MTDLTETFAKLAEREQAVKVRAADERRRRVEELQRFLSVLTPKERKFLDDLKSEFGTVYFQRITFNEGPHHDDT